MQIRPKVKAVKHVQNLKVNILSERKGLTEPSEVHGRKRTISSPRGKANFVWEIRIFRPWGYFLFAKGA